MPRLAVPLPPTSMVPVEANPRGQNIAGGGVDHHTDARVGIGVGDAAVIDHTVVAVERDRRNGRLGNAHGAGAGVDHDITARCRGQRGARRGGNLGICARGRNGQCRRQQGSRSGGKHQTVLDQLSLLKMSPGGGAAGLGIASLGIVCCKARSRTPDRASRTALHRLPFVKSGHRPDGTGPWRSCSAFVPGYRPGSTAIFASLTLFRAKSACLNRALAAWGAKSPVKKP